MQSSAPQPRFARHRPALGVLPVAVALLLAMLQMATPFAHAMLHVARSAESVHAAPGQDAGPGWTGTAADEKPCALCAADHLPALPGTVFRAQAPVVAKANNVAPLLSTRSSAPLDLFCRPPPEA